MSDINNCVISGRVTAKPELKRTADGKAVCNVRIASNKKWKDKTGEWKEKTLYLNCVSWDKQAEACAEYLDKGSAVACVGSLELKQWETNGGEKRERIEMSCVQVNFGQRKQEGLEAGGAPAGAGDDDIPF